MSNKKIDIKMILGRAWAGATLVALVVLANAVHKKETHETLGAMAEVTPTELVRDTVDICVDKNGYVIADDGQYNVFNDVVTRHHFRDVSGTDIGRYTADMINEQTKYNDYHEIRHAFNSRTLMHYRKPVTMDILAADEVSARVAACLAEFGKMPAQLKPGVLSACVSYNLDSSYNLRQVADASFVFALSQLYSNSNRYTKTYQNNYAAVSEQLQFMTPVVNKNTLINEMMTFEINGKPRNMLKLASKDIRREVYNYINVYKTR